MAVCLLLPGMWIVLLLAERLILDVAAAVAVSFAACIAVAGLAASIGYFTGLGLPVVQVALALSSAASVALIARLVRMRTFPLEVSGWPGLLLGFGAAIAAVMQGSALDGSTDTFYHLAAIRSLVAGGGALVSDPFFGTSVRALDPSTGAWHSTVAAWSGLLRTDVLVLWPGVTAVGALVLVACTWSVMRRTSGRRWPAALVTVAFFATVWAFDFRESAYPKFVSPALVMVGLVLLVRAARSRSVTAAVGAAVTMYGAAAMHLGAAELLVIGTASVFVWTCVAVALDARRGEGWSWRAPGLVALAGIVPAAFLTPLVLARAAVLSTEHFFADKGSLAIFTVRLGALTLSVLDPRALPGGLAPNILPAIAGVAAAIALFRGTDRRALLVLALATLPLTVMENPLLSTVLAQRASYVAARTVGLAPWAPFCAAAWMLAAGRGRTRYAASALVAVALVLGLGSAGALWRQTWQDGITDPSSMAFSRVTDLRNMWGTDAISGVRATFGSTWPLVGGSPNTSYEMAGIAPVHAFSVPLGNTPAYFEARDAAERRSIMYKVMDPTTPESIRGRLAVVCGIDYLAVDAAHIPGAMAVAGEMRGDPTFSVAFSDGGLILYRVVRATPARGV